MQKEGRKVVINRVNYMNEEVEALQKHNDAIDNNNMEVLESVDILAEMREKDLKASDDVLGKQKAHAENIERFLQQQILRNGLDQFQGRDAAQARMEQQRIINQASRQMGGGGLLRSS